MANKERIRGYKPEIMDSPENIQKCLTYRCTDCLRHPKTKNKANGRRKSNQAQMESAEQKSLERLLSRRRRLSQVPFTPEELEEMRRADEEIERV